MLGSTVDFPGAYIQFKFTVTSQNGAGTSDNGRASVMNRSGRSQVASNVEEQVDDALEKLRDQYQPKIEALNDCL